MTTIATLFSGGEGVGVGARMAGLDHLWGIEYDAAIAGVARINGFHTITADVTTIDWSTLPAPDVLHASPPCLNFSVAKTNRGETEQDRAVAQAVCDAITTLRPRIFTLENVRGYASGYWPDSTPEDRPKSLGMILDTLTQCGYEYDLMILNSANYGVPQTRERVYVIATIGKRPRCLMPSHSKHGDMFTQRWIGWYEAIADIIDTLPPSQFAPWQLARLPAELIESVLVGDGDTPSTIGRYVSPSPTVSASNGARAFIVHRNDMRSMPVRDSDEPIFTVMAGNNSSHQPGMMPRAFIVSNQATEYSDGIVDDADPMLSVTPQMAGRARAFLLDGQESSSASGLVQCDADDPAFTVTGGTGQRRAVRAAIAGRVVAMTPRALARFQSFPDDYILPEKKSLACRVIGNAVPPRLYAALIGAILEQV